MNAANTRQLDVAIEKILADIDGVKANTEATKSFNAKNNIRNLPFVLANDAINETKRLISNMHSGADASGKYYGNLVNVRKRK
jgi:hypothetical protein